MRAVDEIISNAFLNSEPKLVGATEVAVVDGESALSLHGNIIALKGADSVIQFNNKGYETNVTKSRLNAILSKISTAKIQQIQNEWYMVQDGVKVPFPYNEWVTL